MTGFNFGAFAGGIGQGLEQGQNIREKYRQMADEQIARRAQQAYENYLNPAAAGPAPGGGAPPAPVVPPQPLQNVAMPGAAPMPGPQGAAGPPPPPGGMVGPPPGAPGMAGPPPGPGGAGPPGANAPAPPPPPQVQPTPSPVPPSVAAGGGPGGGAGPPASPSGGLPPPGSPQTQDPIVQSKVAIQAVAKEIAAANPGRKWKHGELLDAVGLALEQMGKVDPIAKQIAQLQLQYYRANLTADTKTADRGERGREADQRADVQRSGLAERIRSDKSRERTAQQRAATYAEMATNSHEDRQDAIAAMNDRANNANTEKERLEAEKEAAEMDRLDKAIENKDWATVAQITAAQARANTTASGKAQAAPALPARPVRQPLAGGGADKPPVAGARKAPDGKWYVADPKRPGKYLMVQ